jgi:prepilin-type N-terminal cleavage/methylation domain-containing protein
MRKLRPAAGGWTLIEVLIVLAIVTIVSLAGISLFSSTGMQTIVTARYTLAPATISLSRGATATFIYTITQQTGSAPASGAATRATTFSVTPSTGVAIESVTNASGRPLAVGGRTASSSTDPSGSITVVVRMDLLGNGTLVATDTQTGRAETAYFTAVP